MDREALEARLPANAEISYVKVARGPIDAAATLAIEKDEALATLDADGKVVFPCEIALTDEDGQLVATATVHWHVRLNQPAAAG
jgi:acyl-coenzyme A thioesterase PaaI-like protein